MSASFFSSIFSLLADALFGCWHTNFTFPMRERNHKRVPAAEATGHHVVCLECGKEFPYDWLTMRPVIEGAAAAQPTKPDLVQIARIEARQRVRDAERAKERERGLRWIF